MRWRRRVALVSASAMGASFLVAVPLAAPAQAAPSTIPPVAYQGVSPTYADSLGDDSVVITVVGTLEATALPVVKFDDSVSLSVAKTSESTLEALVPAWSPNGSPAGSVDVTLEYTGGISRGTNVFTVYGVPAQVDLQPSSSTVTSGQSRVLTATLKDASGNTVLSPSQTVTFSNTGAPGSVTLGNLTPTTTDGVATITVEGFRSGDDTVIVEAATGIDDTAAVNVVSNPAVASITLEAPGGLAEGTVTAGQSIALTATLFDLNGNIVTNSSSPSVTMANAVPVGATSPATVTLTNSAPAGSGVVPLTVTGNNTGFLWNDTGANAGGQLYVTASAGGTSSGSVTLTVVPDDVVASIRVVNSANTSGSFDLTSGDDTQIFAVLQDALGNQVESLSAPASVTFTNAGSGSPLSSVTAVNDGVSDAVAGLATLTVTGNRAGSITASALYDGISSTVSGSNLGYQVLSSSVVASISLTADNSEVTAGQTRVLTATLLDSNGNRVSGGGVVTLTNSSPTTLLYTSPEAAQSGIAVFTVTGNRVGTADLFVSSGSVTSGNEYPVSISVTASNQPASIELDPSPQDLSSGQSRVLTATLLDVGGNPVAPGSPRSVTFTQSGGSGTVVSPELSTAVASSGAPQIPITVTGGIKGGVALQVSVLATAGPSSGSVTQSNISSFQVTPGDPTNVYLTGSNSALASGDTQVLTATLQDAAGNTVTGVNASVSLTQVNSGVTVGSITGLNVQAPFASESGIALFTITGNKVGAVNLQAENPGTLTGANTLTVSVTASNQVARVAVSGDTTPLTSGQARVLTATLYDANNNVVTNAGGTGPLTFINADPESLVAGVPSLTFANLVVEASNGVAVITVTGNEVGTAEVKAKFGAQTSLSDDSVTFDVVASDEISQILVEYGTDALTAGSSRTVTATLQDFGGNTVLTNVNVAFSNSLSGILAGTATGLNYSPNSEQAAQGVAVITITGVGAGAVQPVATTGSVTGTNTQFLVVSGPGVASQSEITATNSRLYVDDTTAVTVLVRDAFGNLVSQGTDSVIISTTLGSLTPPDPVFTPDGQYSRQLSAGTFLGTATISASVNGSAVLPSLGISVVAGPVTQIDLTGTNLASVGAGSTRVLTATLKDAQGRVVTTSTDPVTLSKSSGSGTFLGVPVTQAASSGVATFTVTGGLLGPLTVQANALTATSNSVSAEVTAGSAVSLDLTGSNSSLASGTSRVLTASLLDAGGNPVSGTITFANTEAVAELGTLSISSPGTVTVTGAQAGNAVITAYSDALDDSLTIPVTFGTAAQLTLTGALDPLTAGQARVLTATVRDAYGNLVANATSSVTLTNLGNTGSLIGVPTVTTASSGIATFSVTGGLVGQASVTASSFGLAPGGLAPFDVVPDDQVGGIQITGSNQTLTAGSPRVVTATLVDAGGNPLAGLASPIPVTFSNSGLGVLEGVPTSGLEITGSRAITITGLNSGAIVLSAATETAGVTYTTNNSAPSSGPLNFFVDAAPAQELTFVNQPAGTQTAGVTIANSGGAPLVVKAIDAFGNPATVSGTWSLTASNGLTLQGVTSVNQNVSSVTFANVQLNQVGQSVTLTASLSNVTGTNSTPFDVVPGPATQLSFTNQPVSLVSVADPFSATVEIQDAYGNRTGDDSNITLTIAPAGTLNGGGVSQANDGLVVYPSLSTTNAGTKQLVATVAGLPTVTSSNVVVTAGMVSIATTTVTAANQGPIPATADDSTLITVTPKDQYGNPTSTGVTGVTLLTGAPGALIGSIAQSGGVWTQYLRGTGSGTSTVEARVNSSVVDDSVQVTFVAPATRIALTTSNADLTSGQMRVVTATLVDANGNTVDSSAAVSLTSSNSGAGSILPVAAVNANAGVAVFTVTGNLAGAVNLAASASGPLSGTLVSAFTVVPGSASLATSTVTASPTSIPADGTSQAFVTVQLKDSVGNNLSSSAGTVTLTNSGPGVLVNGGATVYVTNGFYTGYITAPNSQGSSVVSAYLNGQLITGSTATVTFTSVTPPTPPPPAPTVPSAPTIGTPISGDKQVTVAWTAPTSSGGAPITGYRIEQSTDGGSSWTVAVPNTASATTSQVVTGLTNGTAYQFRVAAINSVGAGPNSAASIAVTPSAAVPGAPTNVNAVAGNAEAVVTWVAPTVTGGSAITGYRVEQQRGSGEWTVAIANTASTTATAVVKGLTNGESYRFRVAAINGAGAGANSEPSNAVTPEEPLSRTIIIVGERTTVRGKSGIVVTGESTGFAEGSIFRPWFRFPGETTYTEGTAELRVDGAGEFRWQRQTGKKIYVFVQASEGTRSNRVIIDAN